MNLRGELMKVRGQYGALTPSNVVAAARDESSPLHHRFEWDDAAAAEQFRLGQAAELIRKVRVRYAAPDGSMQDVRAFVVTRGEEPVASVYQPTEEALADPFQARLLLQEFEREWKAFRVRYERLREFRDVVLRDVGGEAA